MINLSGQKVKKFELFKTSDEKNDALKIVLKWSDIPRDLDSHLFTPSQTHLYYGNKNQFDKQGNVMASLNTDIKSKPETLIHTDYLCYDSYYRYSSDFSLSNIVQSSINSLGICNTSSFKTVNATFIHFPYF